MALARTFPSRIVDAVHARFRADLYEPGDDYSGAQEIMAVVEAQPSARSQPVTD
jgi:hypothetical protein